MRYAFLVALAALFALPAQAQVAQGQLELAGSASFATQSGETLLIIAPTLGYFLTDRIEAGAALNFTKISGADASGALGPFVEYHFGAPGATVVPFVGADLGVSLTGPTDLVYGARGGIKYFFLPGAAARAQAFAQFGDDPVTFGALGGISLFL